jgi:hypothetical protein
MSETRYYRGWSRKAADEVSPEDAQRLQHYSRGWLREDGSVERLDTYDRGRLACVAYYDAGADEEVASRHRAMYPDATRVVHRTLGREGDYEWTWSVSTLATGEQADRALVLLDRRGRDIMLIRPDTGGAPGSITKYLFDDVDELLYAFEYRADGRLLSIHDFVNQDHASFDEVKQALPDPDFYETGFALPRSIAGTAIPLDVARRPETLP